MNRTVRVPSDDSRASRQRIAAYELLRGLLRFDGREHLRLLRFLATWIALGSAVFTIAGITLTPPSGDPMRIAAQIVTGIGFLGAGTILRNRDGVHGLTTAAIVWVNAAIGVAAGGGQYHLAIIGGAITLTVLLVLGPIEAAIELRAGPKRTP